MSQSEQIVKALKMVLRAQRINYAHVAAHLQMSEASVKRMFSKASFSLDRLEQVAELAAVRLSELTRIAEEQPKPITELTPQQEEELLNDPKLLLVTYLVLNGWALQGIVRRFQIQEHEVLIKLARLDRLRIIELLPGNRIRRLVARNFSWRPNGPVQAFFERAVKRSFLESRFDGEGEHLRFVGGLLSQDSVHRVQLAIDRLVQEFDELMQTDSELPIDSKVPVGAVFAVRPWELPAFASLKRPEE